MIIMIIMIENCTIEELLLDKSQIQSPRNRGERERLELGQLIGKPVQTFVEPVALHSTGRLDVPLKYLADHVFIFKS